jgi:hypothetical protein
LSSARGISYPALRRSSRTLRTNAAAVRPDKNRNREEIEVKAKEAYALGYKDGAEDTLKKVKRDDRTPHSRH